MVEFYSVAAPSFILTRIDLAFYPPLGGIRRDREADRQRQGGTQNKADMQT